jgi:hypothetical protein
MRVHRKFVFGVAQAALWIYEKTDQYSYVNEGLITHRTRSRKRGNVNETPEPPVVLISSVHPRHTKETKKKNQVTDQR